MQIETVASKEPLEKHPQPRAPGPEKSFDSGPNFSLKNTVRCGWRRACLSLYSEENTVTGFEVPAAFPQLAAAR